MKQSTSFLKRCLALALALVLIASNAGLGVALRVSAADGDEITVTYATLIADNYELTAAEEELLKSGYLAGGSYKYTVPSGLVTIDTENEKIIAESKDGWVPTTAVIVYGVNDAELPVDLSSGEYKYDPEVVGISFSVKVNYELTTTIETTEQESLLGAAAILKQGVANTDAVAAQAGNLYVLEQAMPELVELAENGISVEYAPGFTDSFSLSDAYKTAVKAMDAEMDGNNDRLVLSTLIEDYEAAAAKTGYVMTEGKDMQAQVADLVGNAAEVSSALTKIKGELTLLIEKGYVTEEKANQITTLANVCQNLVNGLEAVNADPWTAANSTGLLADNTDYAKLDTLVAALGGSTAVSVSKTVTVATTTMQAALARNNVTVKVVLKAVNSDNVVAEYASKEVVLTLGTGVSKADILDAVEASGVEAAAIAAWGEAYVEGKYVATATDLPETLEEDAAYTITYAPKEYTVTINGESAEYPYGYTLTLPNHEDASQAYDYYEDGKYIAQGTEIVVTEAMTLTREVGAAYAAGSLLEIIADNLNDSKLTAILTSGALTIDKAVYYRAPSDLEALVSLEGNKLTAQTYPSSYNGYDWTPYSYVVDGTENLFKGATEVTISGDFEKVEVYYHLTLANYSADYVNGILDQVNTLISEAAGQKNAMDRLANQEGNLGSLTKNMLNGLNGVIGGYMGGTKLNSDPATNDQIVADFQAIVSAIIKDCIDNDTGYLKLYNIVAAYNDEQNGGLGYYYANDAYVRSELTLLSGYVNELLSTPERKAALKTLCTENGYSEYVSKIETLGTTLAEISSDLVAANAAINTKSTNLRALAAALTGSVKAVATASPYIEMGPVTKVADKFVSVKVTVEINGKTIPIPAVAVLKNGSLTEEEAKTLKAGVDAAVTVDGAFYTNDYNDGAALDALVGVALTENKSYTYTWTPKTYTVKIAGEADQTITVNNLSVTLPAHPDAANGMSYEYTVDGKTYASGSYEFTEEQLKDLFTDGTYTITRIEKNKTVEDLKAMVTKINGEMGYEAMTLVETDGAYTGITTNIPTGDLKNFAMALSLTNYGYIGLNGEGLVYANDNNELELSLQTLVNAILNDKDFGSETLIALGENGVGKLVTASMQLGADADNLSYTDLEFVLNLTSVPEQMTSAAGYLNTVSPYLTFHSDKGIMVVEANLPEKVYEVYLTAMLAVNQLELSDMNAINDEVAAMFLYDYIDVILNSEADTTTFQNTLEILDETAKDKIPNYDLTQYEGYYQRIKSALTDGAVEINTVEDDEIVDVVITAGGKTAIEKLLSLIGLDASSLSTELAMIKEYKAGGTLTASAVATLVNTNVDYEAFIIDASSLKDAAVEVKNGTNKNELTELAKGHVNDIDYVRSGNLATRMSAVEGAAIVVLLDNVDADLTFNGATIMDLNGKTITGDITANGHLYIFDSSLSTTNCGGVDGDIKGNVTIVAGNYTDTVTDFLADGYVQNGKAVQNTLYTIETDGGNITFVVNTDVIDEEIDSYVTYAKALAAEATLDLVRNYYISALLSADGNKIYDVNFDDLIGLLASDSTAADLVDTTLACISLPGTAEFINVIVEDLLAFGDIEDALNGDGVVASYALTAAPWAVTVEHITDGDYITAGFGSDDENVENYTVTLKMVGDNNATLANFFGLLDDIVEDDTYVKLVDVEDLTFSNKHFNLTGGIEANLHADLSDYTTYMAIVLANSAEGDAKQAIVDAVNKGDKAALKDAFDAITVKDVFTALKVLERGDDFATMAKDAGITVKIDLTAKQEILEKLLVVTLSAAGRALEELDVTGNGAMLGNLDKDDDGVYDLAKAISRSGDVTKRGYGVNYNLTTADATVKVKLFDVVKSENYLLGDINLDGVVDHTDVNMAYIYVKSGDSEIIGDSKPDYVQFEVADVNRDDVIDHSDVNQLYTYVKLGEDSGWRPYTIAIPVQ